MKNILSVAALAAIVSAGAAATADAANLVQDPNFETTTSGFYYGVGNNLHWQNAGTYDGGTLRGVDFNQNTPYLFNYTPANWTAQPAGNFMYVDGGSNYQTYAFTQTINGLTPGQSYKLSFMAAYAAENPTTGDTVQWVANLGGVADFANPGGQFSGWTGGQTRYGPNIDIPAQGLGWVETTLAPFTATASSESLTFIALGSGAPPFALITDINLSGVPEPSTWAIMLLGFGGLGCAARARRRRSMATAV